jgi:hypothetical protein
MLLPPFRHPADDLLAHPIPPAPHFILSHAASFLFPLYLTLLFPKK